MDELTTARIARSLRSIQAFAPAPETQRQVETTRDELVRTIVSRLYPVIRRATKQELAEIVAIIETVSRRHNL